MELCSMTAYLRDAAALVAVVSFVASVGIWAEALRVLAA
jgi:hypothetical protein